MKKQNKITHQQRNALHLFFRMLADAMNDSGATMRMVLSPEVDIDWNERSVKELWKKFMTAQFPDIESTNEMGTEEINAVRDTLLRYLGEKAYIEPVGFPSMEDLLRQVEYEKRNK